VIPQVEFLNKLFDKLKCRADILQFLRDEKLITDDNMQSLLHDHHHTVHASQIFGILTELTKAEKLQLVDYEWKVLPNELMKLTIVAVEAKKVFEYSV